MMSDKLIKSTNKRKHKQDLEGSIEFEQVIERGAGIDVHKETVVVTVQGKGIQTMTRTFGTFTADLVEMKTWLKENEVTHVAMESTGVYWKPVINVLGEDFKVILVNARHIKNVPGHKTDKKDSQWIAKLLLAGLLKGSFIPSRAIRRLRDLTRYRTQVTRMLASEKNRLLKILEDTNIKLSSVLKDVFCVSGRRILAVIIGNENYEVEALLVLMDKKVKASKTDILKALNGKVDEGHRFMLKIIMDHILALEKQIETIDQEIKKESGPYSKELALLQTIPGVGETVAICMIAEIGVDMEQFASHKHLSSWAGMSPGNNESAGKNRSGRTRQGNKWLKTKLVEAAWAASHTKDTYLRGKYRSLVGRKGPKKAVIALGHKILISVYHMLKEQKTYQELGQEYVEKGRKDKLINYHKTRLAELEGGYKPLACA